MERGLGEQVGAELSLESPCRALHGTTRAEWALGPVSVWVELPVLTGPHRHHNGLLTCHIPEPWASLAKPLVCTHWQ